MIILYPNKVLGASRLTPETSAKYYTVGSAWHCDGKVLFAELDVKFRNSRFPIDDILDNLKPHDDRRPHAAKFISSYRVLEHLDFKAIKKLYLANPDGTCLGLD